DTPYPPNAFFVTTADDVTPGTLLEFFVDEVVVPTPPGPSTFCGNDIAVLILAGNVPESTATPMAPRLDDDPLLPTEVYSAVGYGAVDGAGNDAGTRRRRDGLVVSCVSDACVEQGVFMGQITPTEWAGNGGVCQGDSGGPAIDDEGRVIGVTSRGSQDCEASIYAYTATWTTWLKDTVVYASGAGLYDAPAWTEGSTVDPEHSMPIGDPCAVDEDCPSGKCLVDGDVRYCTRACADEHPCPEDYLCQQSTPLGPACVSTPAAKPTPTPTYSRPPKDGCSVTNLGTPSRMGLAVWLAAIALGLGARRSRREPR
ncbi:MAG TPA: trypsin-like serine protease, partial [Polyangiaceae bacterium]|nr:trypsin-like serine protease [Polyangiaceae bacterium]